MWFEESPSKQLRRLYGTLATRSRYKHPTFMFF